jgi:phosphatidylglycerol:prolipoprotein diacylglycerol transferase
VALAIILIRVGCFLNGCCFGKRSDLPWAMSFPRQSWAYWYHEAHAWISPLASRSLHVHPLQLYFVASAVLALAVLLIYQRTRPRPGSVQALWYLMFFASTAMLEPIRQNYLTLNGILTPTAALLAAASLFLAARVPRGIAHPD